MVAEHVLRTAGGPDPYPLHLACVRLLPGAPIPRSWTAICYRLTARVEPLAATAALLDLRPCAEGEAPTLVRGALARLTRMGAPACAGIGPSLAVAQLAAHAAAARTPLVCVTAPELPRYLRTVPVGLLTQLRPQGLVSPAIVARLERFGLRTLAALSRVGERALCRQFGTQVGAFLAAVAAGRDLLPLQSTPPPAWL
ncbi:MAG TPA: hypothetical protein VF916_00570, partial [Ktedonobacterales bacterium]